MSVGSKDFRRFAQRAVLVIALGLLAALMLLLIWHGFRYLLILFGGVLFGVFLNGLSRYVERHTPLNHAIAFGAVIVALLVVLGGLGWLIGVQVASQFGELVQRLPEAVNQFTARLQEQEWSRWILRYIPVEQVSADQGGQTGGAEAGGQPGSNMGGILLSIATNLTYLLAALLIGFYAAVHRSLYERGLLHLVPPAVRSRAREVVAEVGHALRWWLLGRFASMAIVGLLTGLGLWILGVPLALTLGLLAGLVSFIPYLGPLISFVPAVLMGLMESTQTGLYVLGLMTLIQFLETYFITPLMEKKVVSLPPALLIAADLVLGVAAGALGILLAAPLTVVIVVLVQMLYVQDTLDDDSVHVLGT